ncbi:DMP19 family protein [Mesorhizobium loti]|nr:DMP19 family protein [Mesorhizobium loti]
MFGFFSRKSRRASEKTSPTFENQPVNLLVPLVVVSRSKAEEVGEEPFDLVFAVMQFATTMVSKGLYRYPEINPKAMQVYHAHWYSSEIKNGGHSQFIHNAGQEIDAMIANARAGLTASGAKGQLATLEKMSAWVAEHPDKAAEQTGFEGGRDDFLDTLDDAFYDADKAVPMDNLLARWIASWPDLQIVDDDDYDDAINQLATANPQREGRLLHKSVGDLVGQMLGRRDVGAGLACAKISPPEIKLAFGMARVLTVDGQKQMVSQLRTSSKELRLCVATETHVAVYEQIAPEDPPVVRSGENPFGANAPRVGIRLGRAEDSEISTVIELVERYHAPVAVDLLLRKVGFDPAEAAVSANSVVQTAEGPIVNWVVLAPGQAFLFVSSPSGSVLLRGIDDKKLAEATMSELDEHFDRSAAAG